MEEKMYGVVKPKKVDFMLAFVVALVTLTALWIGIWVAASKSYDYANQSLDFVARSFKFDFADTNYWLVLVESVALYSSVCYFVCLTVLAIIRKKMRVLSGGFAVLIAGFAIVYGLGFFGGYANKTDVSGVFIVFLTIMLLALLMSKCFIGKYSLKLVLCNDYYKKEFESENNGVLKGKEKEISALSKSQAVYDAVAEEDKKPEPVRREFVKKELPKREPGKKVEPKVEVVEEDVEDEEGSKFGAANHYTFEQKLKMAKPVAKQYFKEIKAYFEELGFKSNLTKSAETFSYKNTKFAIITTAGKSGLKIYFKLSPANYQDSTLPYKDVSDKKKYEKTPLMFVVKSDLAVRRAKALMDDIKATFNDEKK